MAQEIRKLGMEDLELATGGTGVAETLVSPGGVPLTKIDATQINLRAIASSIEDWIYTSNLYIANVKNYGALGDGATNDFSKIQDAINSLPASGGDVVFPPGDFAWASASGMLTLNGKSNIRFVGMGKGISKITLTGVADTGIFYFTNCSNISFIGLEFVGNNVSGSDGTSGSAIYFDNTGASGTIGGYIVRDCKFTNFRGAGWVRVQNITSELIKDVRISKNYFSGGSDRDPTGIGVAAAQIAIRSSNSVALEDIWVTKNYCDANEVKSGISVLTSAGTGFFNKVHINNNTIINSGQANSPTGLGAYAIACYNKIQDSEISGNIITDPYSVGIYVTNPISVSILGNMISGQEDTSDATLQKGGIAVTNGENISIVGNTLNNNYFGIAFQPCLASQGIGGVISGNTVKGGFLGITLRPQSGGDIKSVSVCSNTVSGQSAGGIYTRRTGGTAKMDDVTIVGNTVSSAGLCIGSDFNLYGEGMIVSDNKVTATGNYGIYISSANISKLSCSNNVIRNAVTWGLAILGAVDSIITNNLIDKCGTIANAATGAIYLPATQASLWGTQITNLPAGASRIPSSGSEDLGLDTPTWSAPIGTKIENLAPADGGTIGWVRTATPAWKTWGAITA